MKKIVILLLCTLTLFGAQKGDLSLYLLKSGKPLSQQSVEIYAQSEQKNTLIQTIISDADGFAQASLPEGSYQLQVLAKEGKTPLVFARKNFLIKAGKESQIILALDKSNVLSFEDSEAPKVQDVNASDVVGVESGFLTLTFNSAEDGNPVKGARVFVKGQDIELVSDAKGQVNIKAPAKEQTLSIIHSDFSAQTLPIVFRANETLTKTISLTPAAMELEEFVVLAPNVQGSIASVMAEEKESNTIANIVGSEQMSKQGDSSAASALKRVTGVTLIGGKDIYVRGLGDRYSNIEMNSMPLPSPHPTKRTIPLDIFPSGAIKSMKIQKNGTADIPSNFGGGYVDIRTKTSSDDDYVKIRLEAKANSNTGKDSYSYQGSGSDSLGFDDGYRDIPSDIINNSKLTLGQLYNTFSSDEAQQYTQSIVNRKLDVTKEALPFGGSLTLEGASTFEMDDEHSLSVFANYKYAQDHTYRSEDYNRYDYNRYTYSLNPDPTQYGTTELTTSEYSHAGLLNIGYSYSDSFELIYTKLYTHTAEKLTRVSDGIAGSNDSSLKRFDLNWEERTLDVDQLNAVLNYPLFDTQSELSFGAENALATLNQPGNYKYAFNNNINEITGESLGDPYLDKGAANIFSSIDSKDELNAFYLKNKFNFDLLGEEEFFDIGYLTSTKDKTYRYHKYEIIDYFSPRQRTQYLTGSIDAIYDKYVRQDDPDFEDPFYTTVNFLPEDYFDATVDDSSLYFNTLIKPSETLEFLLGARQVDYKQTVYQYTNGGNRDTPIYKEGESLSIKDIYPSLGLKYKYDDNNHVDLAYSETFIVPDLREFTDTTYFHPYDVADVVGNPELTHTDIVSYDFKYSHYFSDVESIKVGVFYKELDNPIEDNVLGSSSLPRYSFHNADFAELYGFEVDGRKSFAFISEDLEDVYVYGNFSYTDSKVTLTPEQTLEFTSNHRQLQGLSQEVINLALAYERDDRSATLSLNKMGERIRKVGRIEDGGEVILPDDIEIPPMIIDFVWIEKYDNGLSFRVKLGNLLDDTTTWEQAGLITKKFKTGITYSFALTYKY
ncbi:MAG: carboxypeptidase-like regulatory domain-containing protein [Helicobacteraceae bacterium]|nr:carboxypeptidase-like regulatory domain-containing protein [Helicobacteraceae bacterium]